MINNFEVPQGYEENLRDMVWHERDRLKEKKATEGVHFKEDNMIHQLTTWLEIYDARKDYVDKVDNAEDSDNTSENSV